MRTVELGNYRNRDGELGMGTGELYNFQNGFIIEKLNVMVLNNIF
jgi:hypothetical protein